MEKVFMPNPSTVCADEYDPVELAGCGPRKAEGESDGIVPFDVPGVPRTRSSRPSDGVPGGNADDLVQSGLDTATKSLDTINYEGHVEHIAKLEKTCQQYEAVWKQLKADCKAAFADFDMACTRLRAYIRGLTIPMPLFEENSNESPAGEAPGFDSNATGEGEPEASPSRDPEGVPEGNGEGGEYGFSEPADDTEDDEIWTSTELSGILPAGVAKRLAAARLSTLGQLSEFLAKGNEYSDIPGIGASTQMVIEDALEKFWTEWERGNGLYAKSEAIPLPVALRNDEISERDFESLSRRAKG